MYAIVPSDQTVNASYYSQVNSGIRRSRNVIISQSQTGRVACLGNVYLMITSKPKCTLL